MIIIEIEGTWKGKKIKILIINEHTFLLKLILFQDNFQGAQLI